MTAPADRYRIDARPARAWEQTHQRECRVCTGPTWNENGMCNDCAMMLGRNVR